MLLVIFSEYCRFKSVGRNLAGLPSKAKYNWTDSELVPCGKGESVRKDDEIESETHYA